MSSLPTYFRPASTVQQEFVLIPTGSIAPQPACIIGPLFRVFDVNDSGDRALLSLGDYVPDTDTTYAYPFRPAGGKVDLGSVNIRLENVWGRYATLSGSNVIERGSKANYLSVPTANAFRKYINAAGASFSRNSVFKKRDVVIGDRVSITKGGITLETRITGFINEIIASSTAAPSATTNRNTQGYSGSAVNTNVQGTDHLASVNTATTRYVGDITVPVVNDVYVLECTGAGSAGVQQIETGTVVGTIGASGAGNATVIVTSSFLTGSPLTTPVAVANNDTAAQVAGKIRAALGAITAITDVFVVGGSSAAVTLSKIVAAANDATLNININNGTCSGLTAAPTSADTLAGVAGTATFKVGSNNGDNVAELDFTNIAFGVAFNVGTRGLRVSIASNASQAFIVGEKYTFTVAAAYTRSAPALISASGDYAGAFDAVYKIEVVKGGLWTDFPQVAVTTNNAIDSAPAQIIPYNTSFAVGSLGVVAKFNTDLSAAQNGLVAGDVYYISAVASQKGAVRVATLANKMDDTIAEGDDLSVDFFIYKPVMDLPARGYPEFSSVTVTPTADNFVISGGIVIQDSTWLENDGVTLANLTVIKATAFVAYRALLTARANIISAISDLGSIEAILGNTTVQNPLGISVFKALENSAGQPVYFLPIKSDDIVGYAAALPALERDERPYFKIPTTEDKAINDLFVGHVAAQSAPIRGRECMGIVGTEIDPVALLYSKKDSGDSWTGYVEVKPGSNPAVYTNVTIPGATLLTSGIRAGDEFRSDFGVDAFGADIYESALIDEVIDEETLVLVSPGMATTIGSSSSLQRIQVARLLTLDEQASTLRDISSAFANRRFSNVFQDIGSSRPPYVFAAALAGLASSVAPHQPLTTYTLNGFDDEVGSSRGFTPDQLDVIASGGTLVITKSTAEGQVFIRHQLTTDRSDDLHAEMSVTRNYDSIAAFLRAGFSPFQGKYNINEHYFQLLDVTMRRRLDLLASTTVTESAGKQIISWDQKSLIIAQDTVARTRTKMQVNFVMPMPNNNTDLVLYASA
jgi:hypothetical protein